MRGNVHLFVKNDYEFTNSHDLTPFNSSIEIIFIESRVLDLNDKKNVDDIYQPLEGALQMLWMTWFHFCQPVTINQILLCNG